MNGQDRLKRVADENRSERADEHAARQFLGDEGKAGKNDALCRRRGLDRMCFVGEDDLPARRPVGETRLGEPAQPQGRVGFLVAPLEVDERMPMQVSRLADLEPRAANGREPALQQGLGLATGIGPYRTAMSAAPAPRPITSSDASRRKPISGNRARNRATRGTSHFEVKDIVAVSVTVPPPVLARMPATASASASKLSRKAG